MSARMTSLRGAFLGSAFLASAVALASGCEDDPRPDEAGTSGSAGAGAGQAGEGGAAGAGTAACEEIGSVCHEAEASELGAECHELGHVGDGEVCLQRYDECIEFCTAYVAGGAGGAGHGGAPAGGAAHGGAGGAGGHGGG